MHRNKGFIPGAGQAYDTFFNNIVQYTNAKCSPRARRRDCGAERGLEAVEKGTL
jgi:hypothetical protein